MYGTETPYGEPSIATSSTPYKTLNMPLVPDQNPDGVILKDELWDEIKNVLLNMCEPSLYEQMADQQESDIMQLEFETDPAVVQELQMYIDKADLALFALGCQEGKFCTQYEGFWKCE